MLPAAANCPHELYRELLERDTSAARRVVVVTDDDEPLAVVGLRRRGWDWEPVTNWLTPGYVFPCKTGQLGKALRALQEPVFVSWWRQPQPPPTDLPMRGLKRVSTHGTSLEVDLDAMWRELKLGRSLRKARERTEGFQLEINAPGALEWVIRNWQERWQGPGTCERPELLDRLTVARHLMELGQHVTLTLRDGDRRVAGNTNVVHDSAFVCQTSWRDTDYGWHGVGVRLEELTFRWAKQAGFQLYDLGGGHAYKNHWAPVAGERYQFECSTAAGFLFRRAVNWLGPAATGLAQPRRAIGRFLGRPLQPIAAYEVGELVVDAISRLQT